MTRVEITHFYLGLGMVVVGCTIWWAARHPRGPARFLWPLFGLFMGLLLFVPAETLANDHDRIGWGRLVLDLFSVDPAQWIAGLSERTILEHRIASSLMIGACLVELACAAGRLRARGWGIVLPVQLVVIALLLTVGHGAGGHMAGSQQVHHWILGACLVSGATLLGIHRFAAPNPILRDAWALLLVLAGFEWMFFFPSWTWTRPVP
jgi:hypothetical protein